jgi:hypothetical protein
MGGTFLKFLKNALRLLHRQLSNYSLLLSDNSENFNKLKGFLA